MVLLKWITIRSKDTAEIAQLGERQTEDLKVHGSIPCFGMRADFVQSLKVLREVNGIIEMNNHYVKRYSRNSSAGRASD